MPLNNNSERNSVVFFFKVHRLVREVAKWHLKSCRPPASSFHRIQRVRLNLMLNGLRDYWIPGKWLIIQCQLTWARGVYHVVHFVIKVQKLLVDAGKINELSSQLRISATHWFFLPRPFPWKSPFFCFIIHYNPLLENEWRILFSAAPLLLLSHLGWFLLKWH